MAFTPILQNTSIDYAAQRAMYRNGARESVAHGSPVFFVPFDLGVNDYGYGGPRYKAGYTYYNCPSPERNFNGNCTWWCWARLYETNGTYLSFATTDAKNWYNSYTGSKERNANNIRAGDIIVLTDSGEGHVMFVEQVSGDTVHISQSAYSTRSVWNGYACLVTSFQKSEIYQGNSINMYKGLDSAYNLQVVGVLHTGSVSPTPPEPETDTPELTINPSGYNVVMTGTQNSVDFTFDITLTGIPEDETASGNNTYPGLSRVYNTGWSYTNYTYHGTVYRKATKTQTLRYTREQSQAYSITKHMYFDFTYPNGSVSSDTPMVISVERTGLPDEIIVALCVYVNGQKKRFKVKIE